MARMNEWRGVGTEKGQKEEGMWGNEKERHGWNESSRKDTVERYVGTCGAQGGERPLIS
jgi:hypothetical protein